MSSLSTGAAPRGAGRNAAAVLIAVAVLAVTGAVFGYLIGARANPAQGPDTSGSRGSGSGGTCPAFIQAAAKKATAPLQLLLHVVTDRSEAWICKEDRDNGPLWYQGHRIDRARYPQEIPSEGVNGLLLSQVNALDAGKYLATNTDANGTVTKYTISRTQLKIERSKDGKVLGTSTEVVTLAEP
jgi:hypothetical protein